MQTFPAFTARVVDRVRRIADADAARVVALMSASFASGDLTRGLVAALDQLTAIAGPGVAAGGTDLPNLVDG